MSKSEADWQKEIDQYRYQLHFLQNSYENALKELKDKTLQLAEARRCLDEANSKN